MEKIYMVAVLVVVVLTVVAIITFDGGETEFECQNADDVQECCDNWAEENSIVKIQCVGHWEAESGGCTWICD